MSSDYFRVSSVVAIYQAPQTAYDVFDKVSVLYDGQQIFFGKTIAAKEYFVRMGWHCPEQQTVPDFLTSLSSPSERRPAAGFESRVPTSAEEFAAAWRASPEYTALQEEVNSFNQRHPIDGPQREQFEQYRRSVKSKSV
jgi:ATP-binding cassette subfamily G (WHITE) protein 2 (PDR)